MNGGHDLGGMHGLGSIDPEPEKLEPVFHAAWEKRAFALTLACGFLGKWTLDQSRYARERQHPGDYLRHTYYENWLIGLEKLLVEKGLVSAAELREGTPDRRFTEADGIEPLAACDVAITLAKGGPSRMDGQVAATFVVGDRVRVKNRNPIGHTRVPRYTRGRVGVVETDHGVHVFADKNAHGTREGQHLYSVCFTARELWGDDAVAGDRIHVDLWDSHLEPG